MELTMNTELLTEQVDPQESLKTYLSYVYFNMFYNFCFLSLASAN